MRAIVPAIEERSPVGIAAGIARLITSGDLAPGDRLPTVRELAAELGVSPATVSHAWRSLADAGLIVSRGRSGSFVRAAPREWLPPRYRTLQGQPDARLDLSTGTPDPQLLPSLSRALSRASGRAGTSSYLDVPVIPELEEHLRGTWPYPVEALTVVDGALDGLSRTLEELVRFGDRVAVEDPGFPPIFDLLERLGAERVPVPLDDEGLVPAGLASALGRRPSVLVLQPRAHNPTGVSTTVERAAELARVLRTSRSGADTLVVEDDHSGEIATAPDVSIGLFLPERTVHIRSFSKSHGPDLRIAALGGPRSIIDRVVARRILGPGWTSRMLQSVLLDLLTDPGSVSEVAAARQVYYARQRDLATALRSNGVPARASDGINTWLEVRDEREAIVRLAAAGIRVAAGAPFQDGTERAFVRVTAGLVSRDVDQVARELAAAART